MNNLYLAPEWLSREMVESVRRQIADSAEIMRRWGNDFPTVKRVGIYTPIFQWDENGTIEEDDDEGWEL